MIFFLSLKVKNTYIQLENVKYIEMLWINSLFVENFKTPNYLDHYHH